MASSDHDATDRAGVALVDFRVNRKLNYIFREQPTSDYGVDGHVETRQGGEPSGRLIGVQVKTGDSHFKEQKDDGWIYRPDDRHIGYWLAHSLPMYLLLVDLDAEEIYWQVLDPSTILTGPRGGKYVFVPRAHTFSTVAEYWEQSASEIGSFARDRYAENLTHLPPSAARKIRECHQSAPIASAWLAAHLAQSRRAPALAVRTLLANRPNWLLELGSNGWVAVANYAMCHGLGPEAADAYNLARELDSTKSGQMNFSAGVALLDDDLARAGEHFLSAGQSDDIPQLGALGLTLVRMWAGEDAASDPSVDEQLKTAPEHCSILQFRADRNAETGNLDEAIALLERALALDPENDRILTALARERYKRAHTSARRSDDLSKATELARTAVEQLHDWDGPSVEALKTLLHVLLMQRSFSEVLDWALPPPVGQATLDEAATPDVITAAVLAADDLGREDLIEQLVGRLSDSVQRDFVRASLSSSDRLPADERRLIWQALVENLNDSRPRELVVAVTRLAQLGIDRAEDLDNLVRAHVISTERQEFIRTIAHAASDPDTGLPALRALADQDQAATESLIQILDDAGRTDEAIETAAGAARRLREPRFSLIQAEMLVRRGAYIEARDVIESALISPSLSPSMRRDTHAMLAQVAARSHEWDQIEQHCDAALNDNGSPSRTHTLAWLLVESQVRQGAHIRANETIDKYELDPQAPGEARVWAAAVTSRALDAPVATKLLDLAEQFADDVDLSSNLLTAVVSRSRDSGDDGIAGPNDQRVPLADDIRRRAFAAIEAHIDTHGSASRIQRIRFETPDELVSKLREQLEPAHCSIGELVDQVLRARLPLGVLASATGKSLAYLLATRSLGIYVAASFLEPDCASDDVSVQAAIGNNVVIDTSALMVANLIDDFHSLRGHFQNLEIPQAGIRDLEIAHSDMDGLTASSGKLGWDTRYGQPTYTLPDVEHQLQSLRRLALLKSSLPHVHPIPVDELPTFVGLGPDVGRDAAWLSPIELAKTKNLVLWCDDVALRKLARSVGVQAFGTINLLDYLANKEVGLIADDDHESFERFLAARRAQVTRAIDARIVDIPVDIDQLIEQASVAGFPTDLAQCTVGRPAWWQWSSSRYQDIDKLLAAITDPATSAVWRMIAMDGAASLSPWDPVQAGGFVACVAVAGRGPDPAPSEVSASIRDGEQIAARHEALSPSRVFAKIALALEQLGAIQGAANLIKAVAAEPDTPV